MSEYAEFLAANKEAVLEIAMAAIRDAVALDWQTIETAPRDWTEIILFDPECDPPVFQGYYSMEDGGSDCWMEAKGAGSEQVFPTHWMPLPEPPK